MEELWKDWLNKSRTPREVRVHVDSPGVRAELAQHIVNMGQDLWSARRPILLLCIGTDRSIGDSLGPLVGTLLSERGEWPFLVRGTLEAPVHAGNLVEHLDWLRREHPDSTVVALDACLGRMESVGYITVGRGPLRPGAGVGKPLPQVGNLHLTGVVNVGGFMEYFVLQNTRLHTVMHMAKVMADAISDALTTCSSSLPAAATTASGLQIPAPPPGL